VRIAKEGWPFIIVSAVATVGIYFILGPATSVVPLMGTFFMFYFFRDPERTPAEKEGYLSPADGRIITVKETSEDTFLKGNALLISIFMSPLNVHVNRAPCEGEVVSVRHTPGGFSAAYKEDAFLRNENTAMLLRCGGKSILVRQVAGFLARRTVCRVKPGDMLKRGERFGMIKFSSRLDIYLPAGTYAKVRVGDRVKAGETVIAKPPAL